MELTKSAFAAAIDMDSPNFVLADRYSTSQVLRRLAAEQDTSNHWGDQALHPFVHESTVVSLTTQDGRGTDAFFTSADGNRRWSNSEQEVSSSPDHAAPMEQETCCPNSAMPRQLGISQKAAALLTASYPHDQEASTRVRAGSFGAFRRRFMRRNALFATPLRGRGPIGLRGEVYPLTQRARAGSMGRPRGRSLQVLLSGPHATLDSFAPRDSRRTQDQRTMPLEQVGQMLQTMTLSTFPSSSISPGGVSANAGLQQTNETANFNSGGAAIPPFTPEFKKTQIRSAPSFPPVGEWAPAFTASSERVTSPIMHERHDDIVRRKKLLSGVSLPSLEHVALRDSHAHLLSMLGGGGEEVSFPPVGYSV
ncbi:hypothetical protein BESB_058330 [Besnoitia besnoiti]|uniref:Uncharacterized protein n=1 Tax=Besnoitia besnoiti TaxID=94643 RepID=A0A2A9MG48_BESBE|nr:hypothetical protein BESB_058330 [Besnoitia besnoiti]PFH34946.1 hypothetical protein BESB_058330 [Besnoitia besnoiti]